MGVFVGCAGGSVGVLNCVACVACANWACTVNAACVKTAFGSSVTCVLLDGRLQEERMNTSTRLDKAIARTDLDIVLLLD